MDYLASDPTIKKVRIYAGGRVLQEEDVDVDDYVGDLFKQVFEDYKYVYIKSEKALEFGFCIPELQLRVDNWFASVIRDLALDKQDVIEIYAAAEENVYRKLRIYGGADDKHTDDEYWKRETYESVNNTFGAVLGPVFAMYNYVHIKTPWPTGVAEIRLTREMYLKDVIEELGLLEGEIVIHAFNISGPGAGGQ